MSKHSVLRLKNLAMLLTVLLASAAAHATNLNDMGMISRISQKAQEGYREFLASGNHRAFAVAPGGAWGWRSDEESVEAAIDGAIQVCQRATEQPCVPYAVDNNVVFDAKRWTTLWGPYQTRVEANKAHIGKERGDRFFDLSIRSPNGKPMKLSDLRGKVLLLHFWGTWCSPCRQEMPELQKLNKQLAADKNIQMVLLQMREDFATAKFWAEAQKINLPLYDSGIKDAGEDYLNVAGAKPIRDRQLARVFPTTYVLDKHGIVVFSHVGPVHGWNQYLPFLRDVAARSGK